LTVSSIEPLYSALPQLDEKAEKHHRRLYYLELMAGLGKNCERWKPEAVID
jgi:hypothetical protein